MSVLHGTAFVVEMRGYALLLVGSPEEEVVLSRGGRHRVALWPGVGAGCVEVLMRT